VASGRLRLPSSAALFGLQLQYLLLQFASDLQPAGARLSASSSRPRGAGSAPPVRAKTASRCVYRRRHGSRRRQHLRDTRHSPDGLRRCLRNGRAHSGKVRSPAYVAALGWSRAGEAPISAGRCGIAGLFRRWPCMRVQGPQPPPPPGTPPVMPPDPSRPPPMTDPPPPIPSEPRAAATAGHR